MISSTVIITTYTSKTIKESVGKHFNLSSHKLEDMTEIYVVIDHLIGGCSSKQPL